MTTEQLIVETLNRFRPEDFEEFKSFIGAEKTFPLVWRKRLKEANTQEVMELMMKMYSRQSVEVMKRVLVKMNRTDLVLKLSAVDSGLKVERPSPTSQRVALMESVLVQLLETLADLSDDKLNSFKKILSRIYQQTSSKTKRRLLEKSDLKNTVFSVVQTFGQRSKEATESILKCVEDLEQMEKTDLVKTLLEEGPTPKKKRLDEHLSAQIHTVAVVAAVKEMVLETLIDLKPSEFSKFLWFLQLTQFQKVLPQIPWSELQSANSRTLVELISTSWGLQFVEVTREVLEDMDRTDLVEKLPKGNFGPKEEPPEDDRWPQLKHRVKQVASALERLLETFPVLTYRDVTTLRNVLSKAESPGPYLSLSGQLLEMKADQQDTMFLMVTCSQNSKEKIRKILLEIKRRDLPGPETQPEGGRVDERRRVLVQKVSLVAAVKNLLLETLNKLSGKEFEEFRTILQRQVPQENLSELLSRTDIRDRGETVNLMVDELGGPALDVTRRILTLMKRTDLLETGSGAEDKRSGDEDGKVGSGVKKIILPVLKDLKEKDLQGFWVSLALMCLQRGYPEFPLRDAEAAEDLVDLMVEKLGQQAEEATWNVLDQMNRTDLTFLDGPSRSLDPEGRGRAELQDFTDWVQLEPEVNRTHQSRSPTYSLQSGAGRFECRVSGLRWVCEERVDFKFQVCSWKEHMMEIRRYRPAGPLMDVTVVRGKISELHLPHWICIDNIQNLLDNFAVLHMDARGDVLEGVSDVTPTHVKLTEPSFSWLAVVFKRFLLGDFVPEIKCRTLIYYQPNTPFLKLHVYLIPQDPALQQWVQTEETSGGYEEIKKPRPDKFLRVEQGFSLTSSLRSASIQPQEITLRDDGQDPNFYEVFIENPDRNFSLELLQAPSENVWCCEIRRDDHPKSGPVEAAEAAAASGASEEEHFVDKHREELTQRISNVGPILDGLLKKQVISGEAFSRIWALPTPQLQIRDLYRPLGAARACKDIFYSLLQQNEPHLVAELNRKT